jgi:hypothetical protein
MIRTLRLPCMILVATLAAGALSGCNKTEKPAETQADVNAAASEGAEDVSAAYADRNDVAREGISDVDSAMSDAGTTAHEASQDIAKADENIEATRARAEYDVSIERCDAKTGADRDACKSAAQAVLDAAQARIGK